MLKTLAMAFVIAVISGMGIGSGGFLVIYLTQIENVPQIAAQGINLLFFIFSAGASSLFNIKKRVIRWRLILLMSGAGIVGCLAGVYLAGLFGGDVLQRIFGAMLIISGGVSLVKMLPELVKKSK